VGMESLLLNIWNLLGIPQLWGAIITLVLLVGGVLMNKRIEHSLEQKLADHQSQLNRKLADHQHTLESQLKQTNFLRALYAKDIRKYSREQGEALRSAHLKIFEDPTTSPDTQHRRLEAAAEMVMRPLRKYGGVLDQGTFAEITAVKTYLQTLQGRTQGPNRTEVFNRLESARRKTSVHRIAFRMGLTDHPLEERSEEP
jgi:hypothetical protein